MLTKEKAAAMLKGRKAVTEPGLYKTKAVAVGSFDGRSIVNTPLMTPYHQQKAKEAWEAGDWSAAANQQMSIGRSFGFIPAKGQLIEAEIDWRETKSGEQALFIVNIYPVQAESAEKVSLSFLDEDSDVPAPEKQESEDDSDPLA